MSQETTDDLAADAGGDAIAAVSVAILAADAVLLVRRGREPSRGLWAFPGGRVEPSETDEAAAMREAFEETGLVVADLSEFQTVTITGTREGVEHRYRLRVFLTRHFDGEAVAGDDAEALGWFRMEGLEGLPMARSMAEAARAVLSR